MIEFWLWAGLLLAGCLLLIGWGYWRPLPVVDESRRQINKRLYQQRLSELKQELQRELVSETEYQQLVQELELSLLSQLDAPVEKRLQAQTGSWPWLLGAVVLLLGLVVMLYLKLGSYNAWQNWQQLGQAARPLIQQLLAGDRQDLPEDLTEQDFRQLIAGLQRLTLDEPKAVTAWYWLGKLQSQSNFPEQGVAALLRAEHLQPQRADIQMALAQAYLQTGQNDLAKDHLRHLLQQEPNHQGALMLLAMQEFSSANYQQATELWQRFLQQDVKNPKIRQIVENALARSQQLLAQQSNPVAASPEAQTGGQTTALPQLQLELSLSKAFAGQDLTGKQLVVFAKAAEGPPMPLAVVRIPAKLPAKVMLDDSSAMMPELKLSGFAKVVVTARITEGSDVMAKAGDLEAVSEAIELKPGLQSLSLVIDRQR